MKTIPNILIALALLLSMTACGGAENKEADTGEAAEAEDAEGATGYTVDKEASSVEWKAYKVTGDEHYGKFPIKSGEIKREGDNVTGGEVVVSVADLKIDDLEEGTEDYKKLEGHLKSEDFFAADEHPEAKLEITEVEEGGEDGASHTITANLTIRDKTNSVTFPADVTLDDDRVSAEAKFAIDRMKWDVDWEKTNPAGELVAKNKVDLHVNIKAMAPQS
ncbi:MAG: YceI family protein [Bacteroidota bacterium]